MKYPRAATISVLGIVVFAIAITTALLSAESDREKSIRQAPATEIWRPVRSPEKPLEVLMLGVVEGVQSTALMAPFEGQIKSLQVSIGDLVERNAVIARLDTSLIEASLMEARVQTQKAQKVLDELMSWKSSPEYAAALRQLRLDESALEAARRQLTASQRLYQAGVISRDEVDQMSQAVASAMAQRENSSDALRQIEGKSDSSAISIASQEYQIALQKMKALKEKLEMAEVRSPIKGVVTQLHSSESSGLSTESGQALGSRATEGALIARIVDNSLIRISGTIPESSLGAISQGDSAVVRPSAIPGLTITGRVARVSALPDLREQVYGDERRNARFRVMIEVDPNQSNLPPLGTNAEVTIQPSKVERGVLIDLSAIQMQDKGEGLVTVRRNGEILPQIKAKLGTTTLNGVYVIDGSVQLGDEVLIEQSGEQTTESSEEGSRDSIAGRAEANSLGTLFRSFFAGESE